MMKRNHLDKEKSPYLQQHATNPIDWYPWGEEAFEKARREDKPIFLSIGYSTCHWCHVMERESFTDEEVAQYLNTHYVSIKVDREERPDIDGLYMKVCQMLTGRGGWPLTIVMTPEKIPFYAGTYFPRQPQRGIPGIMDVLNQLLHIYQNEKEKLTKVEASVISALQRSVVTKSEERLTSEHTEKAFAELKHFYDPVFGGFGTGQKFPQPQNLLFLLHYYQLTKEEQALQMVEHTLNKMIEGGIWDHIGFGFSRYTVDRRWHTPHFEKMLYDNALLLLVLTTSWQITKKPLYKTVAEQLIQFIEREMTSSEGAFYSAIDADSEGEEGTYYLYDFMELYEILGEEVADEFIEQYQLTPRGNFEGKNIIIGPAVEEEVRSVLLAHREKRIRPHVDDKILTSWNSLMIAGLARAAKAFNNPSYLAIAQRAIQFIEEKLVQEGRVMARHRDGETKILGYLDDYAFLGWAYIELFEATYELTYLQKAIQTTQEMERLFWDRESGGFFFSGMDGEQLLVQEKSVIEGAMPSGNGVASLVYAKLAKLTGEPIYMQHLHEIDQLFYTDVVQTPSAAMTLLQSVLMREYPSKEVVIIGQQADEQLQRFIAELRAEYLPNTAILLAQDAADFQNVAAFASSYPQKNNQTTFYICEDFVCQQPTNDLSAAFAMFL